MLAKEKLRKADIFSGIIISLFGLWIVSQALKMPMKDSWGGVQNVWFVSPALFPLFVGGMIALLGILLTLHALRTVGFEGFRDTVAWLLSIRLIEFLKSESMLRFHAIVILLFTFVFLNIPRIDFFLGSILFLSAFITMFYLDDPQLLISMLRVYLAGVFLLIAWFILGLPARLEPILPYASDWLVVGFILIYCLYVFKLIVRQPDLRKKYRIGLTLALVAPFTIGPIFKYFLLVPMPFEGLIVTVMDAIRYWDF
ncbi:MAG: hypothetical protein WBG37_18745 [Desulfobacterales bacterium]|jgi:hypothetical protein